MMQRGRSPGFAQETLFVCFCGNQFVWQKLECDEALELDVEGAVDHTHAAHAGKAQNLVIAYAVACGKRGDCVRHRLFPVSLWREAAESGTQRQIGFESATGRNGTPGVSSLQDRGRRLR